MNQLSTKGSGSSKRSGTSNASGAPARKEAEQGDDGDRILLAEEVLHLLRLGAEDRPVLDHIPACSIGGTRRWLRSQVLTWVALGGQRPHHPRAGKRVA